MKKVLIITYYWPPAGGVAVQRITKFCKYFSKYGWTPIVLTTQDGNYPAEDASLFKDINKVSEIYKASSYEPHAIYRALKSVTQSKKKSNKKSEHFNPNSSVINWISDFIRLNVFIPDSRIGWLYPAYKRGLEIVAQHKPDIIFSTAPPFTPHLVARKLAKDCGLPWVADFRDPWVENTLYNTVPKLPLAKLLNKRMEKKVLEQAEQVICVGNNLSKLLASKLTVSEQSKISVVTNGYDPDDLSIPASSSDKFYVSYFGSLYMRRFPHQLFKSISGLIKNNQVIAEKLVLRLVGNIDPKAREIISSLIPSSNLYIHGHVNQDIIFELVYQPQVLLLTIDNVEHNNLIILGKTFDYITTGNPIVGVGPLDGDAANILNETSTGKMYDYSDASGLENGFLKLFSDWQTGKINKGQQRFSQYEWNNLTSKLTGLFDQVSS